MKNKPHESPSCRCKACVEFEVVEYGALHCLMGSPFTGTITIGATPNPIITGVITTGTIKVKA